MEYSKDSKDSEMEKLVKKLLKDALNVQKSNTLDGEAQRAVNEYKKIADALRGFPEESSKDVDPRWNLPPLSPRADT